MKVLGIETSCDETAAAVVEDGVTILSSVVSSQIKLHASFGGVVPELASREHVMAINPVVQQAMDEAHLKFTDLDGIAVTHGPGLVGCLLTGLSTSKALAFVHGIPWVGINHLEGHLFASFLEKDKPSFPLLCLIVSGGHTSLLYARKAGSYEVLGSTRDDAAGEAFDKVAKLLGLGYPGGPVIDKIAVQGNPNAFHFTRPKMKDHSLDFSFSGLKTAVVEHVKTIRQSGKKLPVADLAASFQKAVVDALLDRVRQGVQLKSVARVVVGGGVAANSHLRKEFQSAAEKEDWKVYLPSRSLCTDNAAMIAAVGCFRLKKGRRSPWSLSADPALGWKV